MLFFRASKPLCSYFAMFLFKKLSVPADILHYNWELSSGHVVKIFVMRDICWPNESTVSRNTWNCTPITNIQLPLYIWFIHTWTFYDYKHRYILAIISKRAGQAFSRGSINVQHTTPYYSIWCVRILLTFYARGI